KDADKAWKASTKRWKTRVVSTVTTNRGKRSKIQRCPSAIYGFHICHAIAVGAGQKRRQARRDRSLRAAPAALPAAPARYILSKALEGQKMEEKVLICKVLAL